MGVNVEILRNLQAAEKAGDQRAIAVWQNQLNSLKVLEDAGLIRQLPPMEYTSGIKPPLEYVLGEKRALEAEVERQAERYIDFGFAKRLHISKEKFKRQLMDLVAPQPEAFKGRFDIPAIVIGSKLPIEEQYKMAGVDYYLEGLRIEEWDTQGYRTPSIPHLVWLQDGKINLNESVTAARKRLVDDERGASIYDGLGIYVAKPEILKDHFIDLPGTQVGSDYAPCLELWDGRPRLSYSLTVNSNPRFGSASCGRT